MKVIETREKMIEIFEKNLKIAELGVFEGEFSKIINEVCQPKELYLVDLFEGYFGSGDKNRKNYHYVQLESEMEKLIDYFKTDNKVKIIKSSTTDFLNNLEKDYLDIVYIDADHSYTSVLNDLELSYPKIKSGGMICGHDYVPKTEAEKAVNDFCIKFNVNIDYITKDGCPSFCIIKK